jgi:hypothetical protein
MRSYGVKNAYCGLTQRRKDSKETSKEFLAFSLLSSRLCVKNDLPVAAPAPIAVSIAIATSPPVIVKIPVAGATTSKGVCGT